VSTRLVILGLLREKPLHGYEIKRIIEEEMGDWTSIAFGSIYFALSKLSEEGLTKMIATRREGGRPSRSIYQITALGRVEFLRLLRAVWGEVEREYYQIDVGLAFMDALPRDEVLGYLRRRVTGLEEGRRYLAEHQTEQLAKPDVPGVAAAVFEHSRAHLEAELAWTRALLLQVERGELV
jgi:DNA-binding PadR family transcriptional regulator